MSGNARELLLDTGTGPQVSARLLRPRSPDALLVLGHGAGAGMEHPFLENFADELGGHGVATLRYNFPYKEAGGRRPDSPRVLTATVRAAVGLARRATRGLPIFAGGKSMGGRMTSLAAAAEPLEGVRGLVYVGFPLHGAGRPGSDRAAHLTGLPLPMLFLQGTRDRLAQFDLIEALCRSLGSRAALHSVAEADHSFHVPKRTGRSDAEVLAELAERTAGWMRSVLTD